MQVYTVNRHIKGWAVYDATGARVSGVYGSRDQAFTRRDDMNAAAARRVAERRIPCMCCKTDFLSKGIQNRLCDSCRGTSLNLQMVG